MMWEKSAMGIDDRIQGGAQPLVLSLARVALGGNNLNLIEQFEKISKVRISISLEFGYLGLGVERLAEHIRPVSFYGNQPHSISASGCG